MPTDLAPEGFIEALHVLGQYLPGLERRIETVEARMLRSVDGRDVEDLKRATSESVDKLIELKKMAESRDKEAEDRIKQASGAQVERMKVAFQTMLAEIRERPDLQQFVREVVESA